MADTPAINYDENTEPAVTDNLMCIDDPTGTWALQRVTIQNLFDLLEADIDGFAVHADNLSVGTAAARDVEDTLTSGADIPDGEAVITYGDANWRGGATADFDLSDDSYQSCAFLSLTSGEAISQWSHVYAKTDASNGLRIYAYDADDTDEATYTVIGIAVQAATGSGEAVLVWLGEGLLVRNDTWSFTYNQDEGKILWASPASPGGVTLTRPSDVGDQLDALGWVAQCDNSGTGDYVFFTKGLIKIEVNS